MNNHIYHHEFVLMAKTKNNVMKREKQELVFTIPIFGPFLTFARFSITSHREMQNIWC